MKTKYNKGFIPIIAIVILGMLVVAGGTTALISSKKENVNKIAPEDKSVLKNEEVSSNKNTEVKTEKTNISETEKQVKIETKTPLVDTEENVKTKLVDTTKEQPAEIPQEVKTGHLGIKLINEFLQIPTLDNLKAFCTKAKNVDGISEKKVMNQDKTAYVIQKNSLYDEVKICKTALNEYQGSEWYKWTSYKEDYLIKLVDPSEPDSIRSKKLDYNEKMLLMKEYNLFAYDPSSARFEDVSNYLKPNVVMEKIIEIDQSKRNSITSRMYLNSFLIPEKEMVKLKERLIKQ
ncbi:MAG: hypothetical protein NDI62_03085 [Burkholderiales bacterium]|nr:hypothetical protein [Burkholderiales bacterium]